MGENRKLYRTGSAEDSEHSAQSSVHGEHSPAYGVKHRAQSFEQTAVHVWPDLYPAQNCGWIWTPDWTAQDAAQPRLVLFRKTLECKDVPRRAVFRISADTKYKLFVNGRFVLTGPSRGDHHIWFYDEPDILPHLHKGKNVIGVIVLRYPADPAAGNHGMFRTELPGLYAAGEMEDGAGNRLSLSADSSWKCRINRRTVPYKEEEGFSPLVIHEHAQGDAALFGWTKETYADISWENAAVYRVHDLPDVLRTENLAPRTIPFMQLKEPRRFTVLPVVAPARTQAKREGTYVRKERREESGHFTMLSETVYTHGQTETAEGAQKEHRESAGLSDAACAQAKAAEGKSERQQAQKEFLNAGINVSTNTGSLWVGPHSTKTVELDAEEEMTGYIRLAIAGGKGSRITLLYAEAYVQEEGAGPERITVKRDRTDRVNGHLEGYSDTYLAAGCGTDGNPEVYEPFWFRTFRFVRLTVQTGEKGLLLKELTYAETGYPLQIASFVQTSDPTLKDIWQISARTLKRCMHETYVDCPFYEQLQYIMDARLQALYTYAVSADDRLARKCMDDLRRAQRPDGTLNCSYPNCNKNVIPGFSIYYILMVHDHMMYFGGRELAALHMPAIERILDYFEKNRTAEGYVGKLGGTIEEAAREGTYWSFIDWAKEWMETNGMPAAGRAGPITMETLLYIYGLQHAAELEDYLGFSEKAARYRKQAEECRQAVRKYCTDEDGLVTDAPVFKTANAEKGSCSVVRRVFHRNDDQDGGRSGSREYLHSQHCQVFALLTDTVDAETGRKNLLRSIEEPGFARCTVAMRFYLFRALEKAGLYAYTDRFWDTWREMIKMHCTTCVEAEEYARSECHGWGALILYELPCVTLGVRPVAPGFAKIRISPVPGYLSSASGVVRTPKGDVRVSWEKTADGIRLDYEAPAGAEVLAPT